HTMDGKRSSGGEGGSGDPEVEDEFACAGMLRGSLTSLHSTVERIFRVTFGIGADDLPNGNNGQIWLKLQGLSTDVKAAKLFVKGVVNQEVQQELSYPGALHCIFCGARGLFMDSLIKNTSALIVVGSPGFLLVSGLAEPVVRAYSLIADLVVRYEGTQSKRTEMGDRVLGESLDSRRAFKTLVEKWEDRHVLDLLVLPGTVKEILLDLVKESGLGSSPSPEPMRDDTGAKSHNDSRDDWDKASSSKKTLPDPFSNADRWAEGKATTYDSAAKDPFLQDIFSPAGTRGKAEGAEAGEGQGDSEEPEWQLSMGNKEFWLLLKFFTAMGYTEDVVKRVLKKTGPKEASQILDLVQQEQDLSDREQNKCSGRSTKKHGVILHQGKEQPCETEHKEDEDTEEAGRKEAEHQEDFVLGVMKKAAATCGYTEENVTKIYSMLSEGSTHQLLLELQKKESKETEGSKKEPREIHDVLVEKEEINLGLAETETKLNQPLNTLRPHQDVLQDVKGPPMPTYASSLGPPLMPFHPNKQQGQTTYGPDPATSKQTHQTHINVPNSKRHSAISSNSSVVVTGEQRFLEGLQTPFQLKLTDEPGNPNLRAIVIDGSNVAMSHGLGHFFSCRGIALAVQHFWDRGHRHISALVPQWRQKNDPRIKEQHYMTDLQNLGLLSYTPSREVHGKRISSYDDRLILQLAQRTNGVIVTNDNLRDLSDESPVWRDIIKKRLLQYTFVGDLFMVPDDPLGRGGPHLDDFLRSEHRTPDPGNHSFAGLASSFPSTKPPRSQTEPLNFRDRTPGGAVDSLAFGGRGRSRRSPEETAHLREQLLNIFEGQDNMVTLVLQCHLAERDINVLSDLILEQQK
uniref:KH and NYN domain containing n=1 Tax=Poecilia formosa TaxID=48698 RepID=A0A096LRR0_POEFO